MSPWSCPGLFAMIPYVEHAVVFGANRPIVAAVLAVGEAALRSRLRGGAPDADLASTAEAVRADVADATRDLPDCLRPAGVVLTTRSFSIADGLVTPNLKVRRRQVESAFGPQLDELFEALGSATTHRPALPRAAGTALLLAT